MAKFPYSYGSLDLSKYPDMQFLNVTLPSGVVTPCIVLPVTDKWMRIYNDRNGTTHADISVSIDDASALNEWAARQAAANGRKHTDFHAQIHLTPSSEARKAWQAQIIGELNALSHEQLNERARASRLDRESIANSQYYTSHPERIPSEQEIKERIANDEMNRRTSAGRIYAPSLSSPQPVPAASAVSAPVNAPVFSHSAVSPVSDGQPSSSNLPFDAQPDLFEPVF